VTVSPYFPALDPLVAIRSGEVGPQFEARVIGSPAPQGSKVPKGRTKDGRIILRESVESVGPWRESVKAEAQRMAGRNTDGVMYEQFPLSGPLFASMVFTLPKPKSAPKKKRTFPATKGKDISKLARAVEDALKDSFIIEDDGLIIEYLRLAKVFPSEDIDALQYPGVFIRIWSLTVCEEILCG
jgi:Holliday junction resolvase RusA-like endonuclease